MANEQENKQAISRRDFLRQASKDAIETGVKIVPGASLAKKFVEAGDTRRGDFVEPNRRRWWDKLVSRKTDSE